MPHANTTARRHVVICMSACTVAGCARQGRGVVAVPAACAHPSQGVPNDVSRDAVTEVETGVRRVAEVPAQSHARVSALLRRGPEACELARGHSGGAVVVSIVNGHVRLRRCPRGPRRRPRMRWRAPMRTRGMAASDATAPSRDPAGARVVVGVRCPDRGVRAPVVVPVLRVPDGDIAVEERHRDVGEQARRGPEVQVVRGPRAFSTDDSRSPPRTPSTRAHRLSDPRCDACCCSRRLLHFLKRVRVAAHSATTVVAVGGIVRSSRA